MIDLHMIPTTGYEDNFATQLSAVNHSLVTPHTGIYVAGDLLQARYLSTKLGNLPYVTWIDPDDFILDTTWIDAAVAILESNPTIAAVYPRWRAARDRKVVYHTPNLPWDPTTFNQTSNPVAHNLTIMRRKNVIEVMEEAMAMNTVFPTKIDVIVTHAQMRYGTCVAIPNIAYEWSLRPFSTRSVSLSQAQRSCLDQIQSRTFELASNVRKTS